MGNSDTKIHHGACKKGMFTCDLLLLLSLYDHFCCSLLYQVVISVLIIAVSLLVVVCSILISVNINSLMLFVQV
jgi:hypothetical protein